LTSPGNLTLTCIWTLTAAFFSHRYPTVSQIRAKLSAVKPDLTAKECTDGQNAYQQMIASGISRNIFDEEIRTVNKPNAYGIVPEFDPTIGLFEHKEGGALRRLPVAVDFLRRSTTPMTCSVCNIKYYEICYTDVHSWIAAFGCEDGGSDTHWMWKLLNFPAKLALNCMHELDVCSKCLETNIKATLQARGREGAHLIYCPSENCSRQLQYDEIQTYADNDTFEKYGCSCPNHTPSLL
jgi:hypothetical protein